MKYVGHISSALLLAITIPTAAKDLATCATARLESGADCKEIKAIFDFSKCDEKIPEKTVSGKCWNGKRVAKTTIDAQKLTATFQQESQWGKTAWALASITAEEVKVKKAAPAPVAAVEAPAPAREPAGITVPPVAPPPVPTKVDESLQIGGYLDMYYAYNFNSPAPVTAPSSPSNLDKQPSGNNKYRTFDIYNDDFNVAMAELTFTKKVGNVTGYLELGMGHNVDVLSPNDEAQKHIVQATINYKPVQIPGLSITAGKMMTHVGLEVTKAKDNWNYSRSLLFGLALPFWHEGIAASYPIITDKVMVTGYVYNKNGGSYQTNRSKVGGAQVSVAPINGMTLVYNYIGGPETDSSNASRNRTLHEVNGTYNISEKFATAFDVVKGNITNSNANWFAWSVAAKWTPGKLYLSPRYEVFEDTEGFATNARAQRLTSQTLTLGYDMGGGLESRLEFRRDDSSAKNFPKDNSDLVDNQLTTTASLLYNF